MSNRLRILLIGTSTAETICLEAAFEQAGFLGVLSCVAWRQIAEKLPDWSAWDLICARWRVEDEQNAILPLLSDVLEGGVPRVFFLIDGFEPALVQTLWNSGATRVLAMENLERQLEAGLVSVFGRFSKRLSGKAPMQMNERWNLFYSNPVGMCVFRPGDRICLDCNDRFADLMGWDRASLVGREIFELGLQNELNALTSEGQGAIRQVERKIINRQRESIQILVQLVCVDRQGEKGILCTVQDISEGERTHERARRLNEELEKTVEIRTRALKSANEELAVEITRRAEAEEISNRLEEIIWEAPDIIAIFDLDGYFQYLNKAGRKAFDLGYQDAVDHLDIFAIYPSAMRDVFKQEIYPRLLLEGFWKGETRLLLPDSQQIPVSQLMLYHRGETERSSYMAAILRDIADFKRIEQDLRQNRERYRVLAEAAHDLIFMVGANGEMEYANRFACNALGIDFTRVEGMQADVFFPEELAADMLQMIGEAREIDSPIYTEGPFYLNHEKHWLGTWLVPIHSDDGRLTSILGISRDITDQKRVDEALKQALEDQKQLNEIRTNFFSMTSHQFRTPLSTIILSTELLLKFQQNWDENKRVEHLERTRKAARLINKMLDDILMIGRVESGRYVPSLKNFDLRALCEQSIQEMATNDQDEHHLTFAAEPGPLLVYTDLKLLEGVIDNLLSNALKYSPPGTEVALKIRRENEYIFLEVIDQGIGIPEKEIKNLFQPFHRASNVTDLPGAGIGLTIVQKSMELIQGEVFVRSKEGEGTTFMVCFPVHIEPPMVSEPRES